MRSELFLNRADHELAVARDLLRKGSFVWAISYALRSAEYALEGLIIIKTGERAEKGLNITDLQKLTENYYPDEVKGWISELVTISSLAWQSDLTPEQVASVTKDQAERLCNDSDSLLSWIGKEWEDSVKKEETPAE